MVWNHVGSTFVLNFIFYLDFFIFRFVLSCHQTIHLSKHSLTWSLCPFLATHLPVSLKWLFLSLLLSPFPLSPLFYFHPFTLCPMDSYRPLKPTVQKTHAKIKGWGHHILSPKGIQNLIGDARYIYAVACQQIGSLRGKKP